MKNYSELDIKKILLEKKDIFKVIDWGEGIPKNCNLYSNENLTNCWYIVYSCKLHDNIISSSNVLILEKESNKILYDGSCNDEG